MGEVGGNTLGFYGGLISPSGLLIFAHDYQGGFHLWGNTGRSERESSNVEKLKSEGEHQVADVWTSLPTIGGHFAAVQGLSWEPQGGAFLLSVSSDQTARLHAKWQKEVRKMTIFQKFLMFYCRGCGLRLLGPRSMAMT